MLSAILYEREVFHRQPELSQDLLMRNPPAASLFEPIIRPGQGLLLFSGEQFIIKGRRGQGAGDGVQQHELEEAHRCGNLRIGQPINELVRLLFV